MEVDHTIKAGQGQGDSNAMPFPVALAAELDCARADLSRLSRLISEAFAELMVSFHGIQEVAENTPPATAINRYAMRAVTALQCEDMASQLINFTNRRLETAGNALKNLSDSPQTPLTDAVWAAGVAGCTDLPAEMPVRQESVDAGSMELF